jgi:hypothetical protein
MFTMPPCHGRGAPTLRWCSVESSFWPSRKRIRRLHPLRHMDQMPDYSEMPFAANKARPSREAR